MRKTRTNIDRMQDSDDSDSIIKNLRDASRNLSSVLFDVYIQYPLGYIVKQ